MNLSQSALNKLWQQQLKTAQQNNQQVIRESDEINIDQGSSALSFDAFSRTLGADYSSSRILESMCL
jgi:hypothetical protein